jgi:hypothetical protein
MFGTIDIFRRLVEPTSCIISDGGDPDALAKRHERDGCEAARRSKRHRHARSAVQFN